MPNSYFTELVATVAARLQTLPDKAEEDAEATVRALWHKASGRPLCVEAAVKMALSVLDAGGQTLLQTLISCRLAGAPLGVSILNRLFKHGADYLVIGGWICCEVGLGQGA